MQNFSSGDRSWQLTMPAGYRLELLARMDRPRMLALTDDHALLVGSYAGKVYRLPPPYDRVTIFAQSQEDNMHGVTVRKQSVWLAQEHSVYRIPYRPRSEPYTLKDFDHVADLPSRNGGHPSRTIKTGPNERIYVSLGISGNCSDEYIGNSYAFEDWRGGILVLREKAAAFDSSNHSKTADAKKTPWQVHASGLRNPIGFAWHPHTKVMYASNNGPDHLGYDHPGEYFSQILPGSFHGMPWFWFNGKRMQRDRCISSAPPRTDATPPHVTFPARNAPMDVAFVPPGAFDGAPENGAVVALHGSWATQPAGGFLGNKRTRRPPWIALVHFDHGKAQRITPLIEGFQNTDGERLARPIGLVFGADGALYFTSDGGSVEGLFRFSKKVEKRRRSPAQTN